MRLSKLFVAFAIVAPAFSFASTMTRQGTVEVGYDKPTKTAITAQIKITVDEDRGTMVLAGDETFEGTFEDGKVAVYSKKPRKYFYYVLDFNPPRRTIMGDRPNVLMKETGGGYMTCGDGPNALLKAYKGDGTFTPLCVTLQ